MKVSTFVAVVACVQLVNAATCGDCSSSWACTDPSFPKPDSTECGDSCGLCSSLDCCVSMCYLDATATGTPVAADKCPNGCCWWTTCGTDSECDIAKSIATLLIAMVVISIVVCICIILCICWCCGMACFAGMKAGQPKQQHYSQTHVVQQPYANMQAMQPQPGPPGQPAYPGVKG